MFTVALRNLLCRSILGCFIPNRCTNYNVEEEIVSSKLDMAGNSTSRRSLAQGWVTRSSLLKRSYHAAAGGVCPVSYKRTSMLHLECSRQLPPLIVRRVLKHDC